MSVIIQSRFFGSDLSSPTLSGRFDEIRDQIRNKFKLVGIDVEQAVVSLEQEIGKWKEAELERNPLLERTIEHFTSELTRKLYKHAAQNQISKMIRVFKEFVKNLDGQLACVRKTLQEFSGKLADFQESPKRFSRKHSLEFMANPGWDTKAMNALFASLSEETHQMMQDGVNLAVRLTKGDLRAAGSSLEGLPKSLVKAAAEANEAFKRAAAKEDGSTLDEAAADWLTLSDAAYNAPKIRKEAVERREAAMAILRKLPREPKDAAEAAENLKVAKAVGEELEEVQKLLDECSGLYAQMEGVSPHLGWASTLDDLKKSVKLDLWEQKNCCQRLSRAIEEYGMIRPQPPRAEQPKPKPEPVINQPVLPQVRISKWAQFCSWFKSLFKCLFR